MPLSTTGRGGRTSLIVEFDPRKGKERLFNIIDFLASLPRSYAFQRSRFSDQTNPIPARPLYPFQWSQAPLAFGCDDPVIEAIVLGAPTDVYVLQTDGWHETRLVRVRIQYIHLDIWMSRGLSSASSSRPKAWNRDPDCRAETDCPQRKHDCLLA